MEKVILILAGGTGERLWPLSRKENPKQILRLNSDQPLILETINRFKRFEQVYIISDKNMKKNFQKILPPSIKYIEEPSSRNTAAAIGIALINLQRKFGDYLLFIANSDHILSNNLVLLDESYQSRIIFQADIYALATAAHCFIPRYAVKIPYQRGASQFNSQGMLAYAVA